MPLPERQRQLRHHGGGKCPAASRETQLRTTDDPRDDFLPNKVLLLAGHCHCKSSFISARQKPRSGQPDKVRKAPKPHQAHEHQTSLRRAEREQAPPETDFIPKHLDPNPNPNPLKPTSQPNSLLIWLLVGPSLPRSTQLICNTLLIH